MSTATSVENIRLDQFFTVAEARQVAELITVDGEHFRAVSLAHDVAVTVA